MAQRTPNLPVADREHHAGCRSLQCAPQWQSTLRPQRHRGQGGEGRGAERERTAEDIDEWPAQRHMTVATAKRLAHASTNTRVTGKCERTRPGEYCDLRYHEPCIRGDILSASDATRANVHSSAKATNVRLNLLDRP